MSITFGKDGSVYCDTVRYTYKQTNNLVADNCYGNISGYWNIISGVVDTATGGYKSYRSFRFDANKLGQVQQQAVYPIPGHVYYGSVMWKTTSSSFSPGDDRFELWCNDNANGKMVFVHKNVATNGNWVKLSGIVTAPDSPASGTWYIRNFVTAPTTTCYVSRAIIIDLTAAFGEGREPSKEWCDNNIREHETYVNYGSVVPAITTSNYNSLFSVGGASSYGFSGYKTSLPREPGVSIVSSTSSSEALVNLTSSVGLNNTKTYYGYWEVGIPPTTYAATVTSDIYFPVAEPNLGTTRLVSPQYFNSGGDLINWKRVSMYNKRASFSSGNYPIRWDINNKNLSRNFVAQALSLVEVEDVVTRYNAHHGTNITVNDVNKEWCDCWIDCRSSPIIHIKNPNQTRITFIKPSDWKEISRTSVNNIDSATADSWLGLTDDSWGSIVNATQYSPNDLGYIYCVIDGNPAQFWVVINSVVNDTTISTRNLTWQRINRPEYDFRFGDPDANSYDIQCNDIVIRPETNKITMDATGTITCKKLVRSKAY